MKALLACLELVLAFGLAFGDALEDWAEASEDPELLLEWLEELRNEPLDLNAASAEELAQLPFMDLATASRIVEWKKSVGRLSRLDDLLGDGMLNSEQYASLVQFVKIHPSAGGSPYVRSTGKFTSGSARLLLRGDFRSESAASGFVDVRNDAHQVDATAGIELWPRVRGTRIVAGDFQADVGTGLVFASAFGSSRWLSSTMMLAPFVPSGVRARTTAFELSRLRGAALDVRAGRMWRGTLVGSIQRLSAAREGDRYQHIVRSQNSSDLATGARWDQIEERILGAVLQAERPGLTLGITGYRAQFSEQLDSDPTLSNPRPLTGTISAVGSVFMRARHGPVHAAAEIAATNPGGMAQQSAVSVLRRTVGLSLYQLYAAPDFHSLHSVSWVGVNDVARNQRQLGCKLTVRSRVGATGVHAWTSRTPFRTARYPLRRNRSGVELRSELKVVNLTTVTAVAARSWHDEFDGDLTLQSELTRIGGELTVRTFIELKLRAESRTSHGIGHLKHERGSLLSAQARGRIRGINVSARATLFAADDHAVAFRSYETSPPGVYSVPLLSGEGRRVSAMVSRNIGPVHFAVKLANTIKFRTDRSQNGEAVVQAGFRF